MKLEVVSIAGFISYYYTFGLIGTYIKIKSVCYKIVSFEFIFGILSTYLDCVSP